jgi:hypothetical protein
LSKAARLAGSVTVARTTKKSGGHGFLLKGLEVPLRGEPYRLASKSFWLQANLERVPALTQTRAFSSEWTPVRVKKTRQNKKLEPRSDSIGT